MTEKGSPLIWKLIFVLAEYRGVIRGICSSWKWWIHPTESQSEIDVAVHEYMLHQRFIYSHRTTILRGVAHFSFMNLGHDTGWASGWILHAKLGEGALQYFDIRHCRAYGGSSYSEQDRGILRDMLPKSNWKSCYDSATWIGFLMCKIWLFSCFPCIVLHVGSGLYCSAQPQCLLVFGVRRMCL